MRFGWSDHGVGVEVADARLAEAVAGLFAPLRLSGGGPDEGPDLDVSIVGGRYRLRERGAQPGERRFGTVPELLAVVEHAVALRLLDGRRGETHVHAAGGVLDGRTVMVVGASGAGKSSIALSWSLAGFPLLSDDTLLLDERGRVSGLPRLLKVDRRQLGPHGLSLAQTVAPQSSGAEVWWDPSRSGGWAVGPRVPALLARVGFTPGASCCVRPLSDVEGLRILLDHVLPGGLRPEESVDRFLEVVRSARLVDVTYGSARDAAETLRDVATDALPEEAP